MRVILLLVMMAGVAHADAPGPTFGSSYRFTEQGGEAIYGSVCAGCHMADGQGASGAARYPSLAGNPGLAGTSDLISVVLKGRKAMPAFSASLTDEQIAAVVSYVRQHFGNDFSGAATAAEVAAAR